uniref:ORF198 n=1 Tax=Pseudococcomyxa simplex TaxID=464287 RepID=A0A0Y0ASL1_9CHLO|nr:ORF198 [Pseudococcomyxa simplex]
MLTSDQHELLIGGILGDCYVEKSYVNSRVAFVHSILQLEYVEWKHSVLQPYSSQIVKYCVVDKRTQETYYKVRFKTVTNEIFNPYHKLFYANKLKIVPTTIKDYLKTEIALAVWYLDDGALRTDCKGLRLHTNSFYYDEVVLLRDSLLENFKIDCKPHKQGKGWNLYIGAFHKQSEKFCDIIRPFVASKVPSMLYKLL